MSSSLQIIGPSASGIAVYPAGATFGPRRMREYEFVWMIQGDAVYHLDEQAIAVPQGSIVLCRPETTDFFRWDIQRQTRHAYYHFNIRKLARDWPAARSWPVIRSPQTDGDLMVPLFKHLLGWVDRGDRSLCHLNIELMLRAFVFGRSNLLEPPAEPLPEPVERAMAAIHRRLDADPAAAVRLDELADDALVTPSHLCRLFAAATGHGPVETVQLARLDRATTLICRSNFTLKQIADACGFSSAFHLSHRFSRAFGCSPRDMRRRIESGETPPLPRLIRYQTPHDE